MEEKEQLRHVLNYTLFTYRLDWVFGLSAPLTIINATLTAIFHNLLLLCDALKNRCLVPCTLFLVQPQKQYIQMQSEYNSSQKYLKIKYLHSHELDDELTTLRLSM